MHKTKKEKNEKPSLELGCRGKTWVESFLQNMWFTHSIVYRMPIEHWLYSIAKHSNGFVFIFSLKFHTFLGKNKIKFFVG